MARGVHYLRDMSANLPAPKHVDLSAQYGGEVVLRDGTSRQVAGVLATLTTAYFVVAGITHVARRFWRHDLLSTGKIEIYTIEPGANLHGFATEDFLRYADEANPSRTDVAAMVAIQAAGGGCYLAADQAMRASALELA